MVGAIVEEEAVPAVVERREAVAEMAAAALAAAGWVTAALEAAARAAGQQVVGVRVGVGGVEGAEAEGSMVLVVAVVAEWVEVGQVVVRLEAEAWVGAA